jgi:serine/threonine protein kinase
MVELDSKGDAPGDWNLGRKIIIIFGIAGAMCHLHSRMIMHYDLKTENIRLTPQLEPRIADFGLSRMIEPEPGDRTALLLGRTVERRGRRLRVCYRRLRKCPRRPPEIPAGNALIQKC